VGRGRRTRGHLRAFENAVGYAKIDTVGAETEAPFPLTGKRDLPVTKSDVPPPMPLAMVICDQVYRDPATGKTTLLGIFSTVHARKFPATHPTMGLYVALTDGRGEVPLRIQLIDAAESRDALFKTELSARFPDPRSIIEVVMGLPPLVFPEPGEYRFQVFAKDELVIERRVVLMPLPEAEGEKP